MSLMLSYFVLSFLSHEMSWMRSGTKLGHFLRLFLPTLNGPKPSPSSSAAVYTIKLAIRLAWRSPSSSMCRHGQQLKHYEDGDDARRRTQQLQRVETPGDPLGVSNTTDTLEQKKTTSWIPLGQQRDKCSAPNQPNSFLYVGAIIKE